MRFATPRDLVAALQQRSPLAWVELERLCRDPVQDLVKEINARLGLAQNVKLASDGLLDQPAGSQRLEAILKALVLPVDGPGMLPQSVLRLLQEAGQDYPQHDDVTVLTVRLR